jgi:hydantoinase/carbamoylase family amidase
LGATLERIRQDIETIAKCSAVGPGITRLTFTPEYWAAVDYVAGQLAALGYERTTTSHGNTRFQRRGANRGLPAVAVGSHLDAVPHGGRFDGVAGVVAGVEIARLLAERGIEPERPYEVLVFAEEEGARFGSVLTGSKAMVGRVAREALAQMSDVNGVSYLEALAPYGEHAPADADDVLAAGDLGAYFELHIEQSLVLESARVPVGIVQAIAGIRQYMVVFTGVANHAGATPMGLRRDSLAAAAQVVASVERLAASSATGATVGTVGMVVNEPNAANVVPGRTVLVVDLRDTDAAALEEVSKRALESIETIAAERAISAEVRLTAESAPTVLSPRLRDLLIESATRQGVDYLEMPSGAVHDAQEIARISDVAMIFVPSIGGRSHCPEEDTPYEAITQGVDVLMGAVAKLML